MSKMQFEQLNPDEAELWVPQFCQLSRKLYPKVFKDYSDEDIVHLEDETTVQYGLRNTETGAFLATAIAVAEHSRQFYIESVTLVPPVDWHHEIVMRSLETWARERAFLEMYTRAMPEETEFYYARGYTLERDPTSAEGARSCYMVKVL